MILFLETMELSEPKNFKYVNQSGCYFLPGVDDAEDFRKVKVRNFQYIEKFSRKF